MKFGPAWTSHGVTTDKVKKRLIFGIIIMGLSNAQNSLYCLGVMP